MKNKTIGIFGIGTYLLSIITSATDLAGNLKLPAVLIMVSGVLELAFTIMATIRLWKEAKIVSILLVASYVILSILLVLQEVAAPSYGSPMIILLNITKVINFIVFVWAIIKLFKSKRE
jgi:hypothetical protein